MPKNVRVIHSSPDPTNAMPWADAIDFDPVTRAVTITNFNGLKDAVKQAAINGVKNFALNAAKVHEMHVLYIDLAGVLRFSAVSDVPQVIYAHLAFLDPDSQTVDIVQFAPVP